MRMLIPFLFGILLALHYDYALSWLPYLLVFYTFILLTWSIRAIVKTRLAFGYAIQIYMLLAGYYITYDHQEQRSVNYLANQADKTAFFAGMISESPTIKKWVKLIVEVENGGTHLDSMQLGTGHLLVYLEKDSSSQELRYGDQIVFSGKPTLIETPKNPAAFDAQAYYFKENVFHQIFIKKDKWTFLKSGQGNFWLTQITQWRLHFVEVLHTYLPKSTDFSVASALILGYKDEMDTEVKAAYAATGATHVLAVSGLHVGLIVWITLYFLNLVRWYGKLWRGLKMAILMTIIGVFVLITGAPPSVLRAALLFSIVLIGKEYFRTVNIFNPLATSALVLLIYDPYLILDIGFQLSYLAMMGILYLQPRIYNWWIPDNKVVNYFWQLLSVSLAAQIATLPISLYYFHQIPLYFWLSGLVVIPAATVILILGIILFICSFCSIVLAKYVGILLGLVITMVNTCIFFLEQLPYHLIEGIWLSIAAVVLLYFCVIAFVITWQKRSFKWMQVGLSTLVFFSLYQAYRNYEVYFQRRLVIYHAAKNSLIDCIDQRHAYAVMGDSLQQKQVYYAANNHRQYAKIRVIEPIRFTPLVERVEPTFQYRKNILRFYDQQIIIVDRPLRQRKKQDMENNKRIATDYVLVINSPKITINDIYQQFTFKQIIFDGSNKFWQMEQWDKECQELGLDCYDINKKGAWIKDIDL